MNDGRVVSAEDLACLQQHADTVAEANEELARAQAAVAVARADQSRDTRLIRSRNKLKPGEGIDAHTGAIVPAPKAT